MTDPLASYLLSTSVVESAVRSTLVRSSSSISRPSLYQVTLGGGRPLKGILMVAVWPAFTVTGWAPSSSSSAGSISGGSENRRGQEDQSAFTPQQATAKQYRSPVLFPLFYWRTSFLFAMSLFNPSCTLLDIAPLHSQAEGGRGEAGWGRQGGWEGGRDKVQRHTSAVSSSHHPYAVLYWRMCSGMLCCCSDGCAPLYSLYFNNIIFMIFQ